MAASKTPITPFQVGTRMQMRGDPAIYVINQDGGLSRQKLTMATGLVNEVIPAVEWACVITEPVADSAPATKIIAAVHVPVAPVAAVPTETHTIDPVQPKTAGAASAAIRVNSPNSLPLDEYETFVVEQLQIPKNEHITRLQLYNIMRWVGITRRAKRERTVYSTDASGVTVGRYYGWVIENRGGNLTIRQEKSAGAGSADAPAPAGTGAADSQRFTLSAQLAKVLSIKADILLTMDELRTEIMMYLNEIGNFSDENMVALDPKCEFMSILVGLVPVSAPTAGASDRPIYKVDDILRAVNAHIIHMN